MASRSTILTLCFRDIFLFSGLVVKSICCIFLVFAAFYLALKKKTHPTRFFNKNIITEGSLRMFLVKPKNVLKSRGKPVQHFIQHHSPMLDEMLDEKLNVGWSKIFGLWGFFHPTIKRLKIFIVPFIFSNVSRFEYRKACICWTKKPPNQSNMKNDAF